MKPVLSLFLTAGISIAVAADAPANLIHWIEAQGGDVTRGPDGSLAGISLARTWVTDNDIERILEAKGLKSLDLSFTYVTDRGIERIQQLQHLEDLTLDTAEFITDAALSYLRANRKLRKLVLRGTDVTDISLPYIAQLTALRSLDLSYTQLGDVGLESLPALTELEELNVGGTRISGLNLNYLKLLPKLRKLSLKGIQRRNGGACWSPQITDFDLDKIALLSGLQELNLGIGLSLGRASSSGAVGNCRVAGGITITDLGVAKLAKLKNLRWLEISGAQITSAGLESLKSMPRLERLSLWNCKAIDDAAAPLLAAISSLSNLDLSNTSVGNATLQTLLALPSLRLLYLTETRVTPDGLAAFQKQKPAVFVSWAGGMSK